MPPTDPTTADESQAAAIAQTGLAMAQDGLDAHQRFLRETREAAQAAAGGTLGDYIRELAERERNPTESD